MSGVVDIFLVYQFLKRLVTPWNNTMAFKLGLIDDNGKHIKSAKTTEEKQALGYFDRLVFNLKRLLQLVPGGKSKLGTYAAALLLLREQDEKLNNDVEYLTTQYKQSIDNLDLIYYNQVLKIMEDAPANATGAAVAGTGSDPVHWSNKNVKIGFKHKHTKYGTSLNTIAFLRRKNGALKRETADTVYYKMLGKRIRAGKSASSKNGNGDE